MPKELEVPKLDRKITVCSCDFINSVLQSALLRFSIRSLFLYIHLTTLHQLSAHQNMDLYQDTNRIQMKNCVGILRRLFHDRLLRISIKLHSSLSDKL